MSRYGPEYWDKYGSYRTPIAFHLSVLVLLRAYFIWIVAGLSRRPELDLMSIFFMAPTLPTPRLIEEGFLKGRTTNLYVFYGIVTNFIGHSLSKKQG